MMDGELKKMIRRAMIAPAIVPIIIPVTIFFIVKGLNI
jgi:hypothetical protein